MFNLLLLTNEECYKEQDHVALRVENIVLKCYDKLYANENIPLSILKVSQW
jgi:hypothetical protein